MTTRRKNRHRTIHRSSKTGRLVTEAYAKAHPHTTQRERRPAPRRPRPRRRGR